MTTTPDIFLSYNREDQARAKLFTEAFAARGFSLCWDTDLKTGEGPLRASDVVCPLHTRGPIHGKPIEMHNGAQT